jgi:hypothetical protein
LKRLKDGVAKIEDVPDNEKDWHPRSDGLVLDLVHPSLYCLVYGRTKSISARKSNKLDAINPPQPEHCGLQYCAWWAMSDKFAWIPTDFLIALDGSYAKAKGYINNLQKHSEMYPVVEELVARFVSLFDRVLTDSHPDNGKTANFLRITGTYAIAEGLGDEPGYYGPEHEEEAWRAYNERRKAFIRPPTVNGSYTQDISRRKTTYSLFGRTVQIIVKLANIHLVRLASYGTLPSNNFEIQ